MVDSARDYIPTRSALLELRQERLVMREGYDFLDEKRLLLAAEIFRELDEYEAERAAFEEHRKQAVQALHGMIKRHGLEGASLYPALQLDSFTVDTQIMSFLGVRKATGKASYPPQTAAPKAQNPSPEAQCCADAFRAMLKPATTLALVTGNLYRLIDEYRRTQRRAQALENVLLPETDEALRQLEARLEDVEQEDAIRVRLDYGR